MQNISHFKIYVQRILDSITGKVGFFSINVRQLDICFIICKVLKRLIEGKIFSNHISIRTIVCKSSASKHIISSGFTVLIHFMCLETNSYLHGIADSLFFCDNSHSRRQSYVLAQGEWDCCLVKTSQNTWQKTDITHER